MENKIIGGEDFTVTCDIVRDLMPLTADGVASEDSEAAVRRHIAHCEECRALFETLAAPKAEQSMPAPNDQKIMAYIRRQMLFLMGLAAMLGAAVGIMMLDTSLTFQNLLIMPIVGALSYCCFKKKGFFVSIAVFLLTVVRGLVETYTLSGNARESDVFELPSAVIFGVILGVLTLVGAVIAALLDFTFRKEE